MNFEKDYNRLIDYASFLVRKFRLNIDGGDLVNDAFLEFSKSDNSYSIETIKKSIYSLCRHEQGVESGKVSYNDEFKPKNDYLPLESPCPKCSTTYPINAFYVYQNKFGVYYITKYCKECTGAIRKEFYKNNKDKVTTRWRELYYKDHENNKEKRRLWYRKAHPPIIKQSKTYGETQKRYWLDWYHKNREKWNGYMRERRNSIVKRENKVTDIERMSYLKQATGIINSIRKDY